MLQCGMLFCALGLAAVSAGCTWDRGEIEALNLPATEPVPEGTPWPRLVDAPEARAGARDLDPEEGRRIAADLTTAAAASAAAAETLAGPVVTPAERRRLGW